MKKSKNNYNFKLWIIFLSFVLLWFAVVCSGKGDGLNVGLFVIKPISLEAISVLLVIADKLLSPLVRDVTGSSFDNSKEDQKVQENLLNNHNQ